MVTRVILFCLVVLTLQSCDCNNVDVFGERVVVEVPIESSPVQTIFSVGDTIWWEADFSNQVNVEGVEQRMNLENFNFFADFFITHNPQSASAVESSIDVFVEVGELTLRSIDEFLDYGITMVENNGRYKLKFGTILRKQGVYSAGINTILSFDGVDHPALYACGNTRREDFRIHYLNSATDRDAYETLFVANLVNPEFIESASFERYVSSGSISFTVLE